MGRFENLPKVGDRVKIVVPSVVNHWNLHWANDVGVLLSDGDLVYVTKVTPRYLDGQAGLTISAKPGGAGPRWTIDRFAPVDTTTLAIEAGKFYKTRDGRKVGPLKFWNGRDDGLCEEVGDGRYWSFDGVGHNKATGEDLIAEWVEDPAAAPAKASNDNAEQAARPRFNVGDRVRAIKSSFGGAVSAGDVYSVTSVTDYGIRFINKSGRKDGWNAENFQLVTPAAPTNPAIVCLIEDGQPKPSRYPHVHAGEGEASKEATRLAQVYKGQKFGVYVLTQTVSEGQIYAHEWQNLAANGNKIGAIKALRELASLDLLSAKKAVETFVEKAA